MTGTTNTTAPRETGRPSKYSPKLAGEILQRLASGEMLMGILRRKGMPGRSSVYRWMKEKQDFRDSYARARETKDRENAEARTRLILRCSYRLGLFPAGEVPLGKVKDPQGREKRRREGRSVGRPLPGVLTLN